MSKKCLFCGAILEDEDMFCDECGKKQDEAAAKEEAERRAVAERKAKETAAVRAREEQARKAREEAEAKERERVETELRIKAEAEAKVRLEAEQKAKAEAELKAQEEAAAQAEAKRLEQERRKEERKNNPTHFAWAGLVLGILTYVLLFTTIWGCFPCCIIGLILGIKGLKSKKKAMSIIAIILNGLLPAIMVGGLILSVISA